MAFLDGFRCVCTFIDKPLFLVYNRLPHCSLKARTIFFRVVRRNFHGDVEKERRPMNKQGLVNAVLATGVVADRTGAEVVVEAVFEAMASALANDQRVFVQHFGTFDVRTKKSGVARKPRTSPPVYLVTGRPRHRPLAAAQAAAHARRRPPRGARGALGGGLRGPQGRARGQRQDRGGGRPGRLRPRGRLTGAPPRNKPNPAPLPPDSSVNRGAGRGFSTSIVLVFLSSLRVPAKNRLGCPKSSSLWTEPLLGEAPIPKITFLPVTQSQED